MMEAALRKSYTCKETLGKGHFATVKLAEHNVTKQEVAVKIIAKQRLKPIELENLHHEARVLKLVRHPHVVRLYEASESTDNIYLVLELGTHGDLLQFIQKHGRIAEPRAKEMFSQIADAVGYLHRRHIVHRDLKPENIVFVMDPHSSSLIPKLTDFGLSNSFEDNVKLRTVCGSVAYTAPEVLLGDPYDGPSADVWSLGIILYFMLCGTLPFCDCSDSALVFKIVDGIYPPATDASVDVRHLLTRIIDTDPARRAQMDEIEQHRWLGDFSRASRRSLVAMTESGTFELTVCGSTHVATPEDREAVFALMEDWLCMTHDEVVSAVDANLYDHVASTYALLMERQMRMRVCAAMSPAPSPGLASPGIGEQRFFGRSPQFERRCQSAASVVNGRGGARGSLKLSRKSAEQLLDVAVLCTTTEAAAHGDVTPSPP